MASEEAPTGDEPTGVLNKAKGGVAFVLLFWAGYVAISFAAGFASSSMIGSEVWQLTAWGFVSSLGLLALSRFLARIDRAPRANPGPPLGPAGLGRFAIGFLLGLASYGVHVAIVATFAGPIRFEWVPGVGALAAALYFARFLATSCMEELGFRGYALRRLVGVTGPWAAVCLTAVAFGLSHLNYGWDMRTIVFGVVPPGLLWGMSALATRGLGVPIGLHAAWNFAGWSAGSRAETGILHMVVEDGALESTQAVGTMSYLFVFGALTLAFWHMHRRAAHAGLPPGAPAQHAD